MMLAPINAPISWASCHALGMTAAEAAAAMGHVSCSSAHAWAARSGACWSTKYNKAHVEIADLPPIEPAAVRAIDCRRLWVSVLAQEWHFAFCDAQSGDAPLWRRQARAWFGSADFCEVCDYAGFNPVAVMARFRAKIGSEGGAA